MSATILDFIRALNRPETDEQRRVRRTRIVREDVKNALPGFDPARIAQAQARAERNLRNGYPIGSCVDRAVAWARCAIDPPPPGAA